MAARRWRRSKWKAEKNTQNTKFRSRGSRLNIETIHQQGGTRDRGGQHHSCFQASCVHPVNAPVLGSRIFNSEHLGQAPGLPRSAYTPDSWSSVAHALTTWLFKVLGPRSHISVLVSSAQNFSPRWHATHRVAKHTNTGDNSSSTDKLTAPNSIHESVSSSTHLGHPCSPRQLFAPRWAHPPPPTPGSPIARSPASLARDFGSKLGRLHAHKPWDERQG